MKQNAAKLNKTLKNFHTWLKKNQDYVAMLSHGSIATNDPWIPGFSDYDITIIYKKDKLENFIKAKAYLKTAKLSDLYHFYPHTITEIQRAGTNTFAFSRVFRTKVLFGKNVLQKQQIPKKKVAQELYNKELENEKLRLQVNLVNNHKSTKKVRKEFWRIFKHIFMILAIRTYAKTGKYPRTREEVVKKMNSPSELQEAWETLHHINRKTKEEIFHTGQRLINWLKTIK